MHTSEMITQLTSEALPVDWTYPASLKTRADTHEGVENNSQSIIFCKVIRYPTVMGFYLTDSASRSQYSTVVSLSVRLTTAYLNQIKVD